jgi:16S rRNA (guanine527-N7)-methyltransferase
VKAGDDLDRRLAAGLAVMGIPALPEQRAMLLAFLALMQKWNRTYNLTAIRDPSTAVDLHLLDSLTVWPYLHGHRVLDVGTGAGLPGVPLALMSPERAFALLDSNAKKTRFVQQAVIELGLKNVDVVTARVEQYRPESGFDTVLARAYAGLQDILADTAGLLAPHGKLLAQKGQVPAEEIESIKHHTVRVHRLAIPRVKAERHLIEIAAD